MMPRRRRSPAVTTSAENHGAASTPTLLSLEQSSNSSQAGGAALTESLARKETRVVNVLRVAVLFALVSTAALISAVVYRYTKNEEHENFVTNFEQSATQVVESFHGVVERNMAAIATLSTFITSYAKNTNASFPFVTVPDFELLGADLRVTSSSHLVYFCPKITNANRLQWEEYALEHRFQANDHQREAAFRTQQDIEYGFISPEEIIEQQEQQESRNETNNDNGRRILQEGEKGEPAPQPFTMLDDGTNYHPRIWSNGAVNPRGDEPDGSGPFFALWQQSPVTADIQVYLNMNVNAVQLVTRGLVDIMTREKKALLNYAARPIPAYEAYLDNILSISQYRHDELEDDLHTILSYPVFDNFGPNREMAGILASDIYWKSLFSNLLPSNSHGIICVVENSFNQTFSFRLDGPVATYLGMEDMHDPKYNDMATSTNVNSHLEDRAGPRNRAYRTVALSDTIQYTIHIYPSQDTEDLFSTDQPVLFTTVTVFAFLFASLLFLLYSILVERRQGIMTRRVVENVKRTAETERELNEFLSHEIRNPLSAAISASTFISAAVNEINPLRETEAQKSVREDMEVVNCSLHFINDFMRSMLDIYRASGNQITVEMAPTNILQDIMEPVSCILYKRLANYEVIVDCPPNLIIMTDSIRLKQVVLNLVRNAAKFVERGFLRMRASVGSDGKVQIYVEDSGPGIPQEKRQELFAKYNESLLLRQGSGIGLHLSKKLMEIMDGDIYLDESYHSGIEGYPGTRFVVDMKCKALEIDIEAVRAPLELVRLSPLHDKMEEASATISSNATNESLGPANSDSIRKCHGEPPPEGALRAQAQLSMGHILQKQDNTASTELPDDLMVLFVDDDAMLRKLFMRAVKKAAPANWTIKDAPSGEVAMEVCEKEKFDLVFMDQYMATTDNQLLGTETIQALRSKGVDCTICGLSANDLRDAFINAGADDFVLKPIPCKIVDLQRLLRKILVSSSAPVRR